MCVNECCLYKHRHRHACMHTHKHDTSMHTKKIQSYRQKCIHKIIHMLKEDAHKGKSLSLSLTYTHTYSHSLTHTHMLIHTIKTYPQSHEEVTYIYIHIHNMHIHNIYTYTLRYIHRNIHIRINYIDAYIQNIGRRSGHMYTEDTHTHTHKGYILTHP